LLSPGGEELTARDRGPGLLVIDCAWRKVEKLRATIDGELVVRRLPRLATAYPRKSRVHEDPRGRLASIEAIYAAWSILCGRARLLVGTAGRTILAAQSRARAPRERAS
jgi:ribosome biogenesis protein Tsr3